MLKYQKFNPVYCDTDSIFVTGNIKIQEGNNLGDWKKEEKIVTEIRGLKNYSYLYQGKKHDKIKGVKKGATFENGVYKYKSLVKTKEGLRRNIENGVEIERSKILKLTYDKRKVDKSGTTQPIKI